MHIQIPETDCDKSCSEPVHNINNITIATISSYIVYSAFESIIQIYIHKYFH